MILMLIVFVSSWTIVMIKIKAKKGRSTPKKFAGNDRTKHALFFTYLVETILFWVIFWQLVDDLVLAVSGGIVSLLFGSVMSLTDNLETSRWRANVVTNQNLFFALFANAIGVFNAYVLVTQIQPQGQITYFLAFCFGGILLAYLMRMMTHDLFAQLFCK